MKRRGTQSRHSGQAQTLVICGFDSRLRHCNHATIGYWQAQLAVTQPSREDLQVQLLLVALQTARSFIGTGHRPLKPERRVRFPHGLLSNATKWRNW